MEPYALLPPLLFAFACVLFVTSYQTTFSSGVLAPLGDSLTPPISLLMFAGPGRQIGQLGFPTLCVGFYVCMRRLKRALVAANVKSMLLFGSANTAFAALAVVGLVTLRHELSQLSRVRVVHLSHPHPHPQLHPHQVPLQLDILELQEGGGGGGGGLALASQLHMAAAAVFFLGALVHMATWLLLALSVPRESPVHYRAAKASFGFKLCCCAGSIAPLPASFVYHPASPLARGRKASLVDQGGLQQWVLVGCIASFLASYALELAALPRHEAARMREVLGSALRETRKNELIEGRPDLAELRSERRAELKAEKEGNTPTTTAAAATQATNKPRHATKAEKEA